MPSRLVGGAHGGELPVGREGDAVSERSCAPLVRSHELCALRNEAVGVARERPDGPGSAVISATADDRRLPVPGNCDAAPEGRMACRLRNELLAELVPVRAG